MTRRKTPDTDSPNRVKYTVRSLFPQVIIPETEPKFLNGPVQTVFHSQCTKDSDLEMLHQIDLYVYWIQWGSFWRKLFYNDYSHMVGKNSISENHFGFRKGSSTVDAIQAVVDIATEEKHSTLVWNVMYDIMGRYTPSFAWHQYALVFQALRDLMIE